MPHTRSTVPVKFETGNAIGRTDQTFYPVKYTPLKKLSWYVCECGFKYIDSALRPHDQRCFHCGEKCAPDGPPILFQGQLL